MINFGIDEVRNGLDDARYAGSRRSAAFCVWPEDPHPEQPSVQAEGSSWWPDRELAKHPVGKVFVCGRRVQAPFGSQLTKFARLEIPLSGCYENEIEADWRAVPIRLTPGTALFAPPGCWNAPLRQQPLRLISLLFGRRQLDIRLVAVKSPNEPPVTTQKFSSSWPLASPARNIVEAMVELAAEGGPATALPELVRALLVCVQNLVERQSGRTGAQRQTSLSSVHKFLDDHYQYEITRDSVAEHFGISPSHLSRLFQARGLVSFVDYLTRVRIERAKHLLNNHGLRLEEVSVRCGYRDTAYFCRVFKQLVKMTPTAYRTLQMTPSNSNRSIVIPFIETGRNGRMEPADRTWNERLAAYAGG